MNPQKNSQPHIYNISLFTNVEQDTRNKLKKLVHDLILANEDSRLLIIEKIADIVIPACSGNLDNQLFSEFSGLLIEYLLDYFLELKSTQESEFYHFLSFLSHCPVTEDSPYYPYVQKIMNDHKESEPELMNIFNRLQLLYLLTENGDFGNAEELLEELEPVEENKHLELWALFQLSQTRIYRHQNKPAELLETQLNLILEAYIRDSSDSAINFIIRWLISINWFKQNIIKKTLLLRIKDYLLEQKSLNTAMVLYELFSMEDRLVPSVEKIEYQRILIKYPVSMLN
ncbi:MAG TPA: GGDEF domain-containing protein, partial [Candidatus Cloacimonas acidaminovorans]|nr:GGDEF domain-containing protein [Candidatus Cloacimonas acidaminovorans]